MKYIVVWLKSAQGHLAEIWMNAADREAVSDSANAIDRQLAADPYAYSESRATDTDRILLFPPLGIAFEVSDAEALVVVYAVWHIKS